MIWIRCSSIHMVDIWFWYVDNFRVLADSRPKMHAIILFYFILINIFSLKFYGKNKIISVFWTHTQFSTSIHPAFVSFFCLLHLLYYSSLLFIIHYNVFESHFSNKKNTSREGILIWKHLKNFLWASCFMQQDLLSHKGCGTV